MTGLKAHGDNFHIGTAFELGPVGTAQKQKNNMEHVITQLVRPWV